MITIHDIVHKVNSVLGIALPLAAAQAYRYYVSVTDDVEATELQYSMKYGKGETFCFPVAHYDHALLLVSDMHYLFTGVLPDFSNKENPFADDTRLYLYLFLKPVDARRKATVTAFA